MLSSDVGGVGAFENELFGNGAAVRRIENHRRVIGNQQHESGRSAGRVEHRVHQQVACTGTGALHVGPSANAIVTNEIDAERSEFTSRQVQMLHQHRCRVGVHGAEPRCGSAGHDCAKMGKHRIDTCEVRPIVVAQPVFHGERGEQRDAVIAELIAQALPCIGSHVGNKRGGQLGALSDLGEVGCEPRDLGVLRERFQMCLRERPAQGPCIFNGHRLWAWDQRISDNRPALCLLKVFQAGDGDVVALQACWHIGGCGLA